MLFATFIDDDPKFEDTPVASREHFAYMREECHRARLEYLRALGKGSRRRCDMPLGVLVKRENLRRVERALADAMKVVMM